MLVNTLEIRIQLDNQSIVTDSVTPRTRHIGLLSLNVFAGLVLWFGYSTDLSWTGTIPDLLFPPIVGVVALATLMIQKDVDPHLRWTYRFACLPSLLGGSLAVAIAIVMFVPPFTLGGMFMADEIANERLIQNIASPDGGRIASVYFRGVGAYGSGSGRIFIRVRSRSLPILERDIYSVYPSYAYEDTQNYLRWRDRDTLEIINEPGGPRSEPIERRLRVGAIRFPPPSIVMTWVNLISYVFYILRYEMTGFEGQP